MHRRGHRGYRDVVRFDQVRLARAELCGWALRVSLVLTWHDHVRNFVLEMFFRELQAKATSPHSSPRTAAMQLRNGIQTLDTSRPTFDPHLDIATVVFSHVQCVKTRGNLAVVSKLWRDASKPAAAYPLAFDFDMVPDMSHIRRIGLMDNDEALSLPYERVVGLLGENAEYVCSYAAMRGSVRLLKWARENNRAWSASACCHAAVCGQLLALQYLHENGCPWEEEACLEAATYGHLPVLQYLHENGCPWNRSTCYWAAQFKHWDCLQYAVDNKCPGWDDHAKKYAEHLQ